MNEKISETSFFIRFDRLFALMIVFLLITVPYFISSYEICEDEFDAYFFAFIAIFSFSFLMLFMSFELMNDKKLENEPPRGPVRLKPVLRGPPFFMKRL